MIIYPGGWEPLIYTRGKKHIFFKKTRVYVFSCFEGRQICRPDKDYDPMPSKIWSDFGNYLIPLDVHFAHHFRVIQHLQIHALKSNGPTTISREILDEIWAKFYQFDL